MSFSELSLDVRVMEAVKERRKCNADRERRDLADGPVESGTACLLQPLVQLETVPHTQSRLVKFCGVYVEQKQWNNNNDMQRFSNEG